MRDRTILQSIPTGVRILAATLALLLALPALARADGEKAFNIQRQVLSSALHEFARQSDRQILFSTDIVASKQTAGVRGDLQPEAALQELLKGTGLTYRITADNTILIEQSKPGKTSDTTHNIGKDGSGDSVRLAQATDKSTAGDSSAASQDGEQRSDKSPLQEVIITGQNSRLSSNVDGFPGSVTVVGKEEVQTQLAISSDVGQLLQDKIPGLGVSSHSASDANQTLRGRGLSYYVDGVPISNPLREGSREMRTVAASALAGVEVIRGATALYGNGGNGGSVNYITVRPTGPDGVTGSTHVSLGGSLTHLASSSDPMLEQDLQVIEGPVDLVAVGSIEQTHGFFDADGDRIASDPTGNGGINDSRIYNTFVKTGVNHDAHRLEASFMSYSQEQDTDWGRQILGNEQLGIKTEAALGQVDPRVVPQFTKNQVSQVSYLNRDTLGGTARVQLFYENNEQLFGWSPARASQSSIQSLKEGARSDFNTPITPLGLGAGTALWGVEYIRDRTGQDVNTTPPKVFVPEIDQKDYAGFAQLELTPLAGLTLQAGARYDKFDVSVQDFKVLTTGFAVQGGGLNYSDVVFNAGVAQEINRAVTVYGGFSQGFSLPDIGLAIRAATVADPLVTLRPQPIKVNNYEVGVRGLVLDTRYTLATYLSTSRLGQSFVPDPNDPFVNVVVRDAERLYGAEATADGSWLHGRGEWGGTFTWVDGRVDTNGDGRVDSPFANDRVGPIKLTAYVSVDVASGWPVRLQGLYSGDRNAFPAIANTSIAANGHIHPYEVFDLLTRHKLGPGEFSFAVTNLFNKQYFDVAAQLSGNRPDRYVPAPGAGFRLSYQVMY